MLQRFKIAYLLFTVICTNFLYAQVKVDKPIILTSPNPGERQIENYGIAKDSASAISVVSVSTNEYQVFSYVKQGDTLVIAQGEKSELLNGMRFILSLNDSLENKIFIKYRSQKYPLILNQDTVINYKILSGNFLELVFLNNSFNVMNKNLKTSCKTGFTNVNGRYCIQQIVNSPVTLYQAMAVCASMNARLCTMGEWYYACMTLQNDGINNFPKGYYEWIADAVNTSGQSKTVGGSTTSCKSGYLSTSSSNYRYRCCYNR
jgi:hypothetical protein